MTVSSESRRDSYDGPIRIGLIGCGLLGKVHGERLSVLPGVEITAVSDPSHEAMENVADRLKVVALRSNAVPESAGATEYTPPEIQRFADYRDILAHGEIDAVVISSPNPWHVEQLLGSLKRDVDILCEKPLSMEPAEVQRVIEATEKSGRIVSIGYQSRYRRDARILRRELQSGKWGRVTSVNILATEDWVNGNVGTWRHDPTRCPGGMFVDANGHQLDLLFWLIDAVPAKVRATIETRSTPIPLVTWGDAEVKLRASSTRPGAASLPLSFMFVGDSRIWREEITIVTERADFVLRDTKLYWSDGSAPLAPFPEAAQYGDIPQPTPDTAFIDALRGGEPVVTPPSSVWPVLRFTIAALQSSATGEATACGPA